jgi:hypothetical protein
LLFRRDSRILYACSTTNIKKKKKKKKPGRKKHIKTVKFSGQNRGIITTKTMAENK